MPRLNPKRIAAFRRKILRFYKRHGRDLPFRRTCDPYRIAVAEIMLQQTQVERVVPKYESWVARWPDWQTLAEATTRQLLAMWSGLGYNRRALYLGKLARDVVENHGGVLPSDPSVLVSLPGIGPYTAHAILIFAFNRPLVTIDTNVRRVLLHEFGLPATCARSKIEALAGQLLPKHRSRDWHNALMDYSNLALPKKIFGIPPLTRQTRFVGSTRQIRGAIIRQLTHRKKVPLAEIAGELGRSVEDVRSAAESMAREGIVVVRKGKIGLTN
ncbi:MAG: Fe-S cluster assembly protein HesB [Candidatus Zixiibacteriota bacterium]